MNIDAELRRLAGLGIRQLQEEYDRHAGEPARSNNRTYLEKRIAWRLQAAAEGGLSERARARALDLARESDLRVRPGREVHDAYQRVGTPPEARSYAPPVGSVLRRVYRGRAYVVRVVEGGFELGGAHFRSLSAVAQHITGSGWNGRLFFGLTRRRGPQ